MSDQEMLRRKQEMLRHTIIAQDAAITEALRLLEHAHQAALVGRLVATLQYMTQAMEILASDD